MLNYVFVAALTFLGFCINSPIHALKIEITQGQVAPTPIAITPFLDETGEGIGQKLADVITNDLKSSGLFAPLNPAAFIQDPVSLQSGPRFADWRAINAQCLLMGRVFRSSGQLTIEFRLYDVFSGTEMIGLSMNADPSKWRVLSHMVSDEVYKRITGESGYFNTKIAYVDETGPRGKTRVRQLRIMDWDGENNHAITDGKNTVLTPRISPNNKEMVYLSFVNKAANVYLYDMKSSRSEKLGEFKGLSFAPRFSPDGNMVIMSLAKNGSSALYLMDIRQSSRPMTQLTPHDLIDTSPCFSPDGTQIVFTSDRGGSEQMYVMNKDGTNVHRISFGGGTYSEPVWSPRGDLIAFTKKQAGKFYIGVMAPDGTGERLIADGFLVESPAWTPNGRVLLFTKETRGKKNLNTLLYSVDLTGRNLQKMNTPHEASCGYWSDLLSKKE